MPWEAFLGAVVIVVLTVIVPALLWAPWPDEADLDAYDDGVE